MVTSQLPPSGNGGGIERALGRLEANQEQMARTMEQGNESREGLRNTLDRFVHSTKDSLGDLSEQVETIGFGQRALATKHDELSAQMSGLNSRVEKLELPIADAVREKLQRRETLKTLTVYGFSIVAFAGVVVEPALKWLFELLVKHWFGG